MGARFAVVGGMAVSFRTIERFTKDVDIAVAVETDAEAEAVVLMIRNSGYFVDTVVEQDAVESLSTIRLVPFGDREMFVDILFGSSGIESEVVSSATDAEITLGLVAPVATVSSLIALKTLSANWKQRPQDVLDLQQLISAASEQDVAEARQLLDLISERGYNRNKDLQKDLDGYIEQFKD
ncbi:MAG: nucleotidyl transferase AbiEii/AbiGii toxin family protein [Chloracidobacterium sp.]|nr:nucleotidyl transferase AbiEii/AbiGii toxin family protein [Chloracidobacterium sp.]